MRSACKVLQDEFAAMSRSRSRTRQSSTALIVRGIVTFATVVLAFLAFDDITTDNATSFTVEYACLVACAVWCLLLAVWLTQTRRFVLGGVSLLILGAAIWGQRSISPGTVPSWRPEYVATVSALGWFLVVSCCLVILGFKAGWSTRPEG